MNAQLSSGEPELASASIWSRLKGIWKNLVPASAPVLRARGLCCERKLKAYLTPHQGSSRAQKAEFCPFTPVSLLGVREGPGRRNLSPVLEKACKSFPVTFKWVERMTQLQGQLRAHCIIQQMAASNEKILKERITLCLTLMSMWPPSSVQATEKPTVSNPKSRQQKPPPAKPRRKGLCF